MEDADRKTRMARVHISASRSDESMRRLADDMCLCRRNQKRRETTEEKRIEPGECKIKEASREMPSAATARKRSSWTEKSETGAVSDCPYDETNAE
jgi:hypothetical protein